MSLGFAPKKAANLMEAAGYKNTLHRIAQHAGSGSGGLVLAGSPGVGCSGLLKNFYEGSFQTNDLPIPIYLSVPRSDEKAVETAQRFALDFLTQVIAFRRREIGLATTPIGPEELARLVAIEDVSWTDQALERLNERPSENKAEMVGRYLSVFSLAESAALKAFVMFDNVHNSQILDKGSLLWKGLVDLCKRSSFPTLIAGRRRFVSSNNDFDRIDLLPPTQQEAAFFAAEESTRNSTTINEATCDLLAVQFAARPGFMKAVLKRLAASDNALTGFPAIQSAYLDDLLAGAIGKWFEREIDSAIPNYKRGKIVELLLNLNRASATQTTSAFKRLSLLQDYEFERALSILNTAELINVTSNRVESSSHDLILKDYLEARNRLENLGEPRSVVVSQTLAQCISRSPALMAATYRASTSLGLSALLQKCDGRSIPLALLNCQIFNDRYKGKTDEEIADELRADIEILELPFIVFTASLESAYKPIAALIANERAAFGSGFRDRNCGSDDEVHWLAAEIDSKLPANSEQAEFWCDRLEAAALASNFSNYQIWLIAPDGFDEDASKVLVDRSAFGSSRKQAELLSRRLATPDVAKHTSDSEYEIVIPMGEESELIAAHTLEEIAKKHGIKSHEINQIKTALVEACINASEHSHSPDGRIHQKFAVGDDRITITISNRGVRLADAKLPAADSERRGWGLKLIEKLMDEVHIRQTDDGTSLSMTKRFANA